MTAASKRHLKRVSELSCIVCGTIPVQAHHIRMANLTGAGQKCSDWLTFPLCNFDHANLHTNIKAWERRGRIVGRRMVAPAVTTSWTNTRYSLQMK